jgi:hypothetical protein
MPYLAVICAALLALVAWQKRSHDKFIGELMDAWRAERGTLLTRIQHPEFVVAPTEEVIPDEEYLTVEADDVDLVGSIQTGEPDGDNNAG